MNNWPTKKLKDLLESFDAGVWGKPAPEGKGLLILRSTNITNEGCLDFSDVAELDIHDKIEKLKLLDGDILLEKSGGGPDQPVGRVVYFVAPNHRVYSFANFIQRLRVKPDLIDSHFLFYHLLLLHKIGFTKKLQSQTTGIRNLKLSLYLKTEIPLPPLEIQKQIVERLDKIAEAQKLNDELIQKSDELFQSLLHQELDPAGKDWEVKKLDDVCEIARGGSPRPINKYLTSSSDGINWIKIGDVKEGEKYITSTEQKIKQEGASKTRLVKEGDFILSNSMSFGRPYILKISGAIHDGWLLLRLKNNDISPDFLYYILGSSQTQIQFEKFASGGVVRNLNSDLVRKIKIPVTPIKIQKQIVEKLSAVQEYKKQLLAQKAKLKELFDSVLHKSMKGKII